MTTNWHDRVKDISYRLVSWPSESGTPGEAEFADRLVALLREIPYFRDHPDDIAVLDSHGDPMAKNVVAVVRGAGRRTLALGGHFDTVETSNYLELQHLACQPDALIAALVADLESRPLSVAEQRALDDFRSGDYVPGRGMLDMKSGVAAGIAVLERFSEMPDRQGNLVLFATPDEERNSRGMRALRDDLPDLMRRWDLDLFGGINLDATSDLGDGSEGRAIYYGTIGKLLPFAFVIGQPSHASYPFEGVSAHRIAAEIMQAMEANTDLCDTGQGEISPPPICLEAKDLRGGYEVTTPDRVWLAFNWLFHSRSAADLQSDFNAIVAGAMQRALGDFSAKAEAYRRLTAPAAIDADSSGRQSQHLFDIAERYAALAKQAKDTDDPLEIMRRLTQILAAEAMDQALAAAGIDRRDDRPSAPSGKLISFADLRDTAFRSQDVAERYAALEKELSRNDNPLDVTRRLVSMLVAEARVTGPAVVTGFSSLHYPHSHVDDAKPLDRALSGAIDRARQTIEARHATRFKRREYFTGISDMSFFGTAGRGSNNTVIADNTPANLWVDNPPADALEYPVVNIGPWGREFHQRLERLYMPYAFEVFPDFIFEIASEMLQSP
ncbi:M20/M25/M40 family metallo-hydrolase [Rhizobium sp.]